MVRRGPGTGNTPSRRGNLQRHRARQRRFLRHRQREQLRMRPEPDS